MRNLIGNRSRNPIRASFLVEELNYKLNECLTPLPTFFLRFSLRIFGHAQSVDKGNEDIGEEDCDGDDYSDKECAFATEEESEKMAAAVRSEGPSNLAEKLKVRKSV